MATNSASMSAKLSTKFIAALNDDVATKYFPFHVEIGDELTGVTTSGNDWSEFYVCPDKADQDLLEVIHAEMNNFYPNNEVPCLKELKMYQIGMPCAVRYAKDQQWYRARVMDTANNMIQFIDYGNVQMCADTDIKPLSKSLAEICTICCIQCTLSPSQNTRLPSVMQDDLNIQISIQSPHEPYEVLVMTAPNNSQPTESATAVCASSSALPPERPRPATANGLTLARKPTGAAAFDEDDDLKAAKASANVGRSRPFSFRGAETGYQPQANKSYIPNARGVLRDLYATCGSMANCQHPGQIAEVNTEQSYFRGGPLLIDDMRRIFRAGEQMRYNAKLDKPYISSEMEWSKIVADDHDAEMKKKKFEEQVELTRWLVTDFKPVPNENLLISHAVVMFVSENASSLYVRGTGEVIWAPKAVFPQTVAASARPMKELVDVGRSVIVRAEPAVEVPDLQGKAQWMATAVEFVGVIVEEKGTVYFVRDNYSIIITEGNVGFGYAFIANQFVDAAGVPLEEWYGTRVYFRACVDIPDPSREGNQGIRMKALFARLSPEENKGPFRYPGVYRPPPITGLDDFYSGARGSKDEKKKKSVTDDDALDLPAGTLQEIRLLGVDTIGIEADSACEVPESVETVNQQLQPRICHQPQGRGDSGNESGGTCTIPKHTASVDSIGAAGSTIAIDTAAPTVAVASMQLDQMEAPFDVVSSVEIIFEDPIAPSVTAPPQPANDGNGAIGDNPSIATFAGPEMNETGIQPESTNEVAAKTASAATRHQKKDVGVETDLAMVEQEIDFMRQEALAELSLLSEDDLIKWLNYMFALPEENRQLFYNLLQSSLLGDNK